MQGQVNRCDVTVRTQWRDIGVVVEGHQPDTRTGHRCQHIPVYRFDYVGAFTIVTEPIGEVLIVLRFIFDEMHRFLAVIKQAIAVGIGPGVIAKTIRYAYRHYGRW